ncbi:MAG: hypothetical protein KJZ65_11050 [Phycisphaerales bacterium]|nr:hypothetical protein [Phycisphaerales bacterium]
MFEPLELSLSLSDVRLAGPARSMPAWVREQGFRWVHLNAAARGFRPRELDGAARRDLAATLSRAEVRVSGVDLWIPPQHFAEAVHVDRAVDAVVAVAELLGDLARLRVTRASPVVSLMLPDKPAEGVAAALAAAGEARGVLIVDHSPAAGADAWWGADPATLLMHGDNPGASVSRRGSHVLSARLSDANAMGRCAVGSGRLDVLEYAMALTTAGVRGPVVLDVRGLPDALGGIERGRQAWGESTRLPDE